MDQVVVVGAGLLLLSSRLATLESRGAFLANGSWKSRQNLDESWRHDLRRLLAAITRLCW